MSYQILYSRQFVKLPNGIILPLILDGSNNCSEYNYITHREVRERSWSLFLGFYNATPDKILDKLQAIERNSPENEYFKNSSTGKWICGRDLKKWFIYGCRNAKTIEEIHSLTSRTINCTLVVYNNNYSYTEKGYQTSENEIWCSTSDDLINWIEKAQTRIDNKKEEELIYVYMDFGTRKPLGIGRTYAPFNGPFIVKRGNSYFVSADENSYTMIYDRNNDDVTVFNSDEEFEDKIKGTAFENLTYIKVSAESKPKPYYIEVIGKNSYNGLLIYQKTKTKLRFTTYIDTARSFASENEARRFITNKLCGFSSELSFAIRKKAI